MKVLHILNTNKFSGAENVVCQIIDMFRDDADVEMLYCSPEGPIRQALQDRKVSFVPISTLNTSEVKRVISEQKPDIVHSHDIKASIIAAFVCKGIKIINTIHGNSFSMRKLSAKSVMYYFAAKKASHIFWVSSSCFENFKFKKSVSSKSSVLYNVINCENIYARATKDDKEYKYHVVYIGRISSEKDPFRLIDVLSLCIKRNHSIKAAIVGEGELLQEAKNKVEELGIKKNIDFLGFMSNPYKLMSQSRVMVMTSKFEGTPMCALEAMALGLPIVSTPTDGLCELVDNEVTGYLGTENEYLADKIFSICNDEELFNSMSEATKKRFANINNNVKFKESLVNVYC